MQKKKNLVVVIGGASNSSTDRDEQIKTVVVEELAKNNVQNIELVDLSSFGKKKNIKDWFGALKPEEYNSLICVGKSLGGVRLYQAYSKHKKVIDRFPHVSLVFVDAHSPFPN